MTEDESHRSLTAYVLVAIAGLGLWIAICGISMGILSAAVLGGLTMMFALVVYGARPTRYE